MSAVRIENTSKGITAFSGEKGLYFDNRNILEQFNTRTFGQVVIAKEKGTLYAVFPDHGIFIVGGEISRQNEKEMVEKAIEIIKKKKMKSAFENIKKSTKLTKLSIFINKEDMDLIRDLFKHLPSSSSDRVFKIKNKTGYAFSGEHSASVSLSTSAKDIEYMNEDPQCKELYLLKGKEGKVYFYNDEEHLTIPAPKNLPVPKKGKGDFSSKEEPFILSVLRSAEIAMLSKDTGKKELSGVCIKRKNNKVNICGTDRFAIYHASFLKKGDFFDVIIPATGIKKNIERIYLDEYNDRGHVRILYKNGIETFIKKIEKRYPEIEQIFSPITDKKISGSFKITSSKIPKGKGDLFIEIDQGKVTIYREDKIDEIQVSFKGKKTFKRLSIHRIDSISTLFNGDPLECFVPKREGAPLFFLGKKYRTASAERD